MSEISKEWKEKRKEENLSPKTTNAVTKCEENKGVKGSQLQERTVAILALLSHSPVVYIYDLLLNN
jgi:hypothetical protein